MAFLFLTTLSTSLAAGLQGGDWNTFANGPAHTGYYPGTLGTERFLPAWSIPFTNYAESLQEFVVANGLVIFEDTYRTPAGQFSNQLCAIDVDNGRPVWSRLLPRAYYYNPTHHQGRIYLVQDNPHVIWCFSADTGDVIWTNRLSSTPAAAFAPTVAEGGVWFRTSQGRSVAGFDTNGQFRFETFVGGYSWDPYWTVSYYEGLLYSWNLSDLKALHPVTGAIVWETNVNQYTPTFVSIAPALADGYAFLNMRERLAAVNLTTHAVAWTNNGAFIGTPAVHNGIVYITSTNGVQAFRAADGLLLREYGPMADPAHIYTSGSICPIITDDVLIAAFTSNTYIFHAETTALLQTIPVRGNMALANGMLLIGPADMKLRAFALPGSNDLMVTGEATNQSTVWNPLRQTFSVRNSGPGQATGVQLVYRIPSAANFVSAVPAQGSCIVAGGEVICELGTLAATGRVDVSFQIIPTAVGGLTAEATVSRTDVDGNPDNNLSAVTTDIVLPRVTVTPFSVIEGNSGLTSGAIRFSLSGTSAVPVSVGYSLYSYSAVAGIDFLGSNGVVVFPPGTIEQSVNVSIVGDNEYEIDEAFHLSVSNVTNAEPFSTYLPCTILNDDPAPIISISNLSRSERNTGTSNAVFTLTLSKTSSLTASVFLMTSNLTAEAGSDYGSNATWISFAAGTRTQFFTVPIYGDVSIEPDETFRVLLLSPNYATLGSTSVIGTILNDDGMSGQIDRFSFGTLPSIAVNNPFNATLSALDANSNPASTFNAAPKLEAMLDQSSVLVAVGNTNESSPLPFGPLLDNYAGYLHCEFIYLASELKGPRRLTALEFLLADGVENLTIRMQHTPRSSFVSPAWTPSGWTTVFATNSLYSYLNVFTFQTPFEYNGVDNLLIEFDWKAYGRWYSSRPGTDTRQLRALFWTTTASYYGIPVGAPSATSLLPTMRLHGDAASVVTPQRPQFLNGNWSGPVTVTQPLGTFALRLDDRDGHISATPPLTTELLNDLSLRVNHPEVIISNTSFVYTIAVSNTGPAASSAVTVSNVVGSTGQLLAVTSSQGTPIISGNRFTCALGVLPAGGVATILVEAVGYNTFPLSIDATVTRAEAELYRVNNSASIIIAQPPRITISDSSISEGTSWGYNYMSFTVTVWPPSASPVSVLYSTEDISASSEYYDSNKDYYSEYGTLTFNPGQTSQTIYLDIVSDATMETNETFRVRLRNPVNGVLQKSVGTGTIMNDDFPSASIFSTSIVEGDNGVTNAVFFVNLSQPALFDSSISFRAISGTALAGVDFLAATGFAFFPAGQTNQWVSVPVNGDVIDEPDEIFYVRFESPLTNIVWTNLQAACTIFDNDPPPLLSINNASVVERNRGYTNLVFDLNLSVPSARSITVDFTTANLTATAGSDFLVTTGRVTFAPGVSNVSLSVPVIGDTQIESNEQMLLIFSKATNTVLSTNIAVGTIFNDDGIPGELQRFELSSVASPQFVNQSFPLTISARDAAGAVVDSFNGQVTMQLRNSPSPIANADFESLSLIPWFAWNPYAPFGLTSFDIDGDGSFSKALRVYPSDPSLVGIAQWVNLHGGVSYVFRASCALFNSASFNDNRSNRVNLVVNSNITTVLIPPLAARQAVRFNIEGTFTPSIDGSNKVGITFATLTPGQSTIEAYVDDVIVVTPQFPNLSPGSVTFSNGVWTGAVSAGQPGVQMNIDVADNDGHIGGSNPFDVRAYNDLSATFAPLAAEVPVDLPLLYSLLISNSGPSAAAAVVVTNFLPPNVDVLSIEISQGAWQWQPSGVRFDLGNLAPAASAQIAILVRPNSPGPLTNRAVVATGLGEIWLGNNHPAVVNYAVLPLISISNPTVNEGHVGTNNAIVNVTLSAPRVRDVWARYVVSMYSSAQAGSDFIGSNWLVHFPPGVTNQKLLVPIVGDVVVEPTEQVTLSLIAFTNALPLQWSAIVTIVNDDGLPGVAFADALFNDSARGNGNGILQPGEIVELNVLLRNTIQSTLSNITSTLYCLTPGITLLNSNSPFANMPDKGVGTNLVPFVFHIPKSIPCGSPLKFILITESEFMSDIVVRRQNGLAISNAVLGCAVVNNPPETRGRTFTVGPGTPHNLFLSGFDIDGDPLSFEILGYPPNAQLSNFDGTQGTFTYAAPVAFEGTHTIGYRVLDGSASSAPGAVMISVFRDVDVDGMPDDWEDAHGLNSADSTDAERDADFDGRTNLQEYLAGTRPNDASSVLRVWLNFSSGSIQLEFIAQSNRSYSVEFADTASISLWRLWVDVAPGTNERPILLVDPQVTSNRFYRVVTPGRAVQ
jgi:uncharacterized repeat protein (TIGR01451 family)